MSLLSHGNLAKPLERINERGLKLVALIAHGDETGKPLSIEAAAKRMKLRIRYVRALLKDPIVKAELALQRDAMRAAAQPEAVAKLIETMRAPGEGLPADRRLQYDAARAILGEDAKAPTVNVGVQVNNQTNVAIRPGYVIRMPNDVAPPATINQTP